MAGLKTLITTNTHFNDELLMSNFKDSRETALSENSGIYTQTCDNQVQGNKFPEPSSGGNRQLIFNFTDYSNKITKTIKKGSDDKKWFLLLKNPEFK